jgi:hypothetical protein
VQAMNTDAKAMSEYLKQHFIRIDDSIGENSIDNLEKLTVLCHLGIAYSQLSQPGLVLKKNDTDNSYQFGMLINEKDCENYS